MKIPVISLAVGARALFPPAFFAIHSGINLACPPLPPPVAATVIPRTFYSAWTLATPRLSVQAHHFTCSAEGGAKMSHKRVQLRSLMIDPRQRSTQLWNGG